MSLNLKREAKFKHLVKFTPAYDKRNPEPSKNYGIGAMEIFFILQGRKGAISFTMSTGMYLPHVTQELKAKNGLSGGDGWDISYHSKKPIREWQNKNNGHANCPWLNGHTCWSDGSALSGGELFKKFVSEGEEIVWKTLEEWYHETFDPEVSS